MNKYFFSGILFIIISSCNSKNEVNVEDHRIDSLVLKTTSSRDLFPNKDKHTNQLNEYNNKEGLWVVDDGLLTEIYYKNGLKNGLYRSYSNNKLYGFGEYKDDIRVGIWYGFDQYSRLRYIEKDIVYNPDAKQITIDGETFKPFYTSYLTLFYPDGLVQEEGYIVYNEDLEIGYSKIRNWKYYNKNDFETKK